MKTKPSWFMVCAIILLSAVTMLPTREGIAIFSLESLLVVALRYLARWEN